MEYSTQSPNATQKIAKLLAEEILKKPIRSPHALLIALRGDLGAGKTTFTQGFARGLGLKKRIVSPTFILVRSYGLSGFTKYHRFYHLDAYRIKKLIELNHIHWKKIIADSSNIILVEWPENIKNALPKNTLWISLNHGNKENERTIQINNK